MFFGGYLYFAVLISTVFGVVVGYGLVKDGGRNGEFYTTSGDVDWVGVFPIMLFLALIPFVCFMLYALIKYLIEKWIERLYKK